MQNSNPGSRSTSASVGSLMWDPSFVRQMSTDRQAGHHPDPLRAPEGLRLKRLVESTTHGITQAVRWSRRQAIRVWFRDA